MTNTLNTGLIPTSSPNYAPDYTLGDTTIGKYISLNGARKFYNPGIGLTLSSPNSGATTNVSTMITSSPNSNVGLLMKSNSGGDTAFVGYPDSMTVTGDIIPGFINRTVQIVEYSNSGGHLLDSSSVHPDPSIRIMNILTPGQYVFKVNGSGISQWTSSKNFNFDFGWYINISGQEVSVAPIKDAVTTHVGGQADYLAEVDWVISGYTSPIYTLNTGDYLQFYCKSIGAIPGATGGFKITNLELDIQLTTTASPTQSTFSNSLNIADFKTSSINLYGGNRDTLVIQGTKLTNS